MKKRTLQEALEASTNGTLDMEWASEVMERREAVVRYMDTLRKQDHEYIRIQESKLHADTEGLSIVAVADYSMEDEEIWGRGVDPINYYDVDPTISSLTQPEESDLSEWDDDPIGYVTEQMEMDSRWAPVDIVARCYDYAQQGFRAW
jgi:hypothetical protein